MKQVLLILLLFVCATDSYAQKNNTHPDTTIQKHHLFVDASYPVGGSATYNYKTAKFIGVGIGIQGHQLSKNHLDNRNNITSFYPTVFLDLRFYIRSQKQSQFFSFLDFGMSFYKRNSRTYIDNTSVTYISHNNAGYVGIGLGYFYKLTDDGKGIYLSAKLPLGLYTIRGYDFVENREVGLNNIYGQFTYAIGFRF